MALARDVDHTQLLGRPQLQLFSFLLQRLPNSIYQVQKVIASMMENLLRLIRSSNKHGFNTGNHKGPLGCAIGVCNHFVTKVYELIM